MLPDADSSQDARPVGVNVCVFPGLDAFMIDEFSFPMCLDPGRVKRKWVFCLKIARIVFSLIVVGFCVFLVGIFSILSHPGFMHVKWWRIFLLGGVLPVGLRESWAR